MTKLFATGMESSAIGGVEYNVEKEVLTIGWKKRDGSLSFYDYEGVTDYDVQIFRWFNAVEPPESWGQTANQWKKYYENQVLPRQQRLADDKAAAEWLRLGQELSAGAKLAAIDQIVNGDYFDNIEVFGGGTTISVELVDNDE